MTGERTILRGTTVVDVRDGSLRRDVDINRRPPNRLDHANLHINARTKPVRR